MVLTFTGHLYSWQKILFENGSSTVLSFTGQLPRMEYVLSIQDKNGSSTVSNLTGQQFHR